MRQQHRLLLAIGIGVAAAFLCYWRLGQRQQAAADFTFPWRAARYLLVGRNPYLEIAPEGEYPFQTQFYYPLPAALVAIPFSMFPPKLAGAMFFGLGSGLLAYALSGAGVTYLPMFASAPYLVSLSVAQWSPWLIVAMFIPNLQWLFVCKPNIGLAGYFYHPTRRGILAGLAFLALSLAVLPSWPNDWWAVTREIAGHPPPFLIMPFGPVLLLAGLRWREGKGRLFLAMSILPQLLFFYDQLPLWLIPRRFRTSLIFSGLSWVAYFAWQWSNMNRQIGTALIQPYQPIITFIYLPALFLLLFPEIDQIPPVKDHRSVIE